MKKTLSVFLTLCMLLGSIGCTVAETAAEPTKLVWMAFNADQELLDANVALWNERHPDRPIEIDHQVYATEEMHSKLLLSMNSGVDMPDIVDIEISKFGLFMDENPDNIMLEPIDALIEKYRDDLVMARYENYHFGDHYYGAEKNVGTSMVYYNAPLVEAAGIDWQSIRTTGEWVEAGRKFKEATGKPWTAFEIASHNNPYAIIAQHGGDFFDAEGNVALNSDVNVETFTWMQELVKEGVAVPAPGGAATSEAFIQAFSGDEIACVIMPSWYCVMSRFLNPGMSGKLGLGVMPAWEGSEYTTACGGGTATCVVKGENAELAMEFLESARFSYEANMTIGNVLGMDPCRTDTYAELAQSETFALKGYLVNNYFDVVLRAQESIPVTHVTANFPYAVSTVGGSVCYRILDQLEDVKTVLDEGAAEIEMNMD